ncbi:right-handed parallel beta-helix repeat-containing protein [Pseudonocardia spinosispora]|uniref:right-handed parallel beta-helix repeat-containing protein n=1 Tax=Pseudonocardia spinosispora TaxID=103441 RepID=UPI00041049A4|nr:right-handed parallel beta-helix repeat-containing protein [Pseudonocardia spinosispora]
MKSFTLPRWPRRLSLAVGLVCVAVTLAACGGAPPVVRPSGPAQPVTATSPDGKGAIRPLPAPSGCTDNVIDGAGMTQALRSAAPGDVVCLQGDISDTRAVIQQSGTPQAPIKILGGGKALVKGVTVEGDNIVVSGINAVNPAAPGISLDGNNITLENSTSISPRGDDGDAVRFWGSNITIKHNTMRNTIPGPQKAHADCMQTFATDADHVASQNVLIDNNRCEDISNMCLIVEGPNSVAGDGSGIGATSNITFSNNYCQNRASQALQIDDTQKLTVTNNDIVGDGLDKAFALQNKSTGAKISGNKLNSKIKYEVGMDDSSRPGYIGPEVGGDP